MELPRPRRSRKRGTPPRPRATCSRPFVRLPRKPPPNAGGPGGEEGRRDSRRAFLERQPPAPLGGAGQSNFRCRAGTPATAAADHGDETPCSRLSVRAAAQAAANWRAGSPAAAAADHGDETPCSRPSLCGCRASRRQLARGTAASHRRGGSLTRDPLFAPLCEAAAQTAANWRAGIQRPRERSTDTNSSRIPCAHLSPRLFDRDLSIATGRRLPYSHAGYSQVRRHRDAARVDRATAHRKL